MQSNQAVYKIFTEDQWNEFIRRGTFKGTELDLKDGFIHLSAKSQVDGVLRKFFANVRPLYIAKFDAPHILEKLVWENANPENPFPHLYNQDLMYGDVVDFYILE